MNVRIRGYSDKANLDGGCQDAISLVSCGPNRSGYNAAIGATVAKYLAYAI